MSLIGTESFPALGTNATLLVDDLSVLAAARRAVDDEVRSIDAACSRFRADSDLSRVNASSGRPTHVSPRCIEAISVALGAAASTDGLVDPTLGSELRALGYDRSFAEVTLDGPPVRVRLTSRPSWQAVDLDPEAGTVCVPSGVELDLGATAKALCADRAARAVHEVTGAAVVVGIGGDISIAGAPPPSGWLVRVADDHTATDGGQVVALHSGGLATSGTTRRTWTRGAARLHHLVDPRTGTSAIGCWRTVSVTAHSCVDANIATTASIVLGEDAIAWLSARRLAGRLVTVAGDVVVVGGWPEPHDDDDVARPLLPEGARCSRP